MFETLIDRVTQATHVLFTREDEKMRRARHGERAGRTAREKDLAKRLASLESRIK